MRDLKPRSLVYETSTLVLKIDKTKKTKKRNKQKRATKRDNLNKDIKRIAGYY